MNPLVIMVAGIALIAVIGAIIYLSAGLLNEGTSSKADSSATSPSATAPNARIIGTVVQKPGTPPEIDYIVITIDNPASGTPLRISKDDLTIFYQDSENTEKVSYPPAGRSSGFISNGDDKASISTCSDIAKQPTYKAVWCYLNDGTSNPLAPGKSSDIYIFVGGLSAPLMEDSAFRIELEHPSANWSQTLMGQTPPHLEPLPTTEAPAPTVEAVSATPSPTTEAASPQPTQPAQPGIIFTPPSLPQGQPTAVPAVPVVPVVQPTAAPQVGPTAAPQAQPTATPTLVRLPARNVQQRPHVFVGTAKKGGQLVPTGTKITVWIDGYADPVGESTTEVPAASGNNYSVMVYQYGTIISSTSSLSFHIGKQDTGQVHAWTQGGGSILDLTVD